MPHRAHTQGSRRRPDGLGMSTVRRGSNVAQPGFRFSRRTAGCRLLQSSRPRSVAGDMAARRLIFRSKSSNLSVEYRQSDRKIRLSSCQRIRCGPPGSRREGTSQRNPYRNTGGTMDRRSIAYSPPHSHGIGSPGNAMPFRYAGRIPNGGVIRTCGNPPIGIVNLHAELDIE
jgi:hypothetical protein